MSGLIFLVDFDNTLIDNDGVKADIAERMAAILGETTAARFWELYEAVRAELDVVDFHEVLRRLRAERPGDRGAIALATGAIASWDFRPRLYPASLDLLAHLDTLGEVFVVSDGDPLFQVTKIRQSGVTAAVAGRVLVFVHKERYLQAFVEQFPADHYVMVDDKPGVLMRSKAVLGDSLTTVFVRQGRYATDPRFGVEFTPDVTLERIADLQAVAPDALHGRRTTGAPVPAAT